MVSPGKVNSEAQTPDTRPWYFLHIPKTAGTTFRVLLENQFAIDEICPAYEFHELKQYADHELNRFRLFRGHLGYNLVNYLPVAPRVLTILRNPLERVVSHFEQIRRDPGHRWYQVLQQRRMGLKEYLLDPELSAEVTNTQVRQLSHMADRKKLAGLLARSGSQQEFARHWRKTPGVLPPPEEMLEIALSRLETMELVFTADHMDRGAALACWKLGGRPQPVMQALNVNARRSRLESLPDDLLQRIQEMNVLDLRLYEQAGELFERHYREMTRALLEQNYREIAWNGCRDQTVGDLVQIDFSQPLRGTGWHQRELLPGRGMMRWTGPGTCSDIDVPLDPRRSYRMKMVVVDWADEEVLRSLSVEINGEAVPLRLVQEHDVLCLAWIDSSLLREDRPFTRIILRLARTLSERSGEGGGAGPGLARQVGIAVLRFEFVPEN